MYVVLKVHEDKKAVCESRLFFVCKTEPNTDRIVDSKSLIDKGQRERKKVFQLLDKLHIPYERVENDVVETTEECEEIDRALGTEIRKSIFLCNQKKTSFFLIVMPAAKQLDTSALEKKLGVGHLSFASAEMMEKHLGAKPGSASVMGLVNDEDEYVQLIIDKEVADAEWFGCNPGINTDHLKLKTADLLNKFLPRIYHKAKIMELSRVDGKPGTRIKFRVFYFIKKDY